MITDDDIPEEVKRGVETAMYGRPLLTPTVSTKKRYASDRRRFESHKEWLERKKREAKEKLLRQKR